MTEESIIPVLKPDPPEEFIVKFLDGPWPGEDVVSEPMFTWPLPEKAKAMGEKKGVYRKIWESKNPGITDKSLRGAIYQWDEDGLYYDLQEDE